MAINIKKAVIAAHENAEVEVAKPMSGSELSGVLKQLIKDKGQGVIYKGNQIPAVEKIPTGIFEFDLATAGGVPRNRIIIVYGPESSGKSNICYCVASTVQKDITRMARKVVWIDLEHAFDPWWVAQFGIDLEDLIVIKPGYGEEAVDIVDAVLHAEDVALVVVDSVAVLTSTKELDQSAEKFDVATSPMLIKRMTHKIAHAFSKENKRGHNPTVIYINQTRFKIGLPPGHNPETYPGGNAMRFMSALTLRMRGVNVIEKAYHPDKPAFKHTEVEIKKAKVPISQSKFEYDMAMMPIEGYLRVGGTNSWGIVSTHLKSFNVLAKATVGSGWQMYGQKYPTLVPIQDRYLSDPAFMLKLQQDVIARAATKLFTIDPVPGS